MSAWKYDRASRTVFDVATGDAVVIVSDIPEADEMHRIGEMIAGLPGLRQAACQAMADLKSISLPPHAQWRVNTAMDAIAKALEP